MTPAALHAGPLAFTGPRGGPHAGPIDDQAAPLRRLVDRLSRRAPEPQAAPAIPARASREAVRRGRIVAVTSGKGGVGKTCVSVNLAVALRQRGLRVVLVDADVGLANADVLCGLTPARRLSWAASEPGVDLGRFAQDAPGGFRLVPGCSCPQPGGLAGTLDGRALARPLHALARDYDAVLIDTGAGVGPGVLSFLAIADHVIVLATPEPTALTDAYAIIKWLHACAVHPRAAATPLATNRVLVVVNQARGRREARAVHARLSACSRRFLGSAPPLLGWIAQDVRVADAVRRRFPVLLDYPFSPASRGMRRIARALHPVLGSNHE